MVLLQLASWLELAHKTGFAHRNLKPTNVIQLSGSSNLTVTDFGCAARIGVLPASAVKVTCLCASLTGVCRPKYSRKHACIHTCTSQFKIQNFKLFSN